MFDMGGKGLNIDRHIDETRINQPITNDSAYNQRMKEEQQKKLIADKVASINSLRTEAEGKTFHYVELMNYIERLLHACGAEPKTNFIDISRDFMKILTRLPMKANLHQFLPDDDKNNPRFHKVVSQILITIPQILGIRWVPTDGGTILILSIKRD